MNTKTFLVLWGLLAVALATPHGPACCSQDCCCDFCPADACAAKAPVLPSPPVRGNGCFCPTSCRHTNPNSREISVKVPLAEPQQVQVVHNVAVYQEKVATVIFHGKTSISGQLLWQQRKKLRRQLRRRHRILRLLRLQLGPYYSLSAPYRPLRSHDHRGHPDPVHMLLHRLLPHLSEFLSSVLPTKRSEHFRSCSRGGNHGVPARWRPLSKSGARVVPVVRRRIRFASEEDEETSISVIHENNVFRFAEFRV
ncbi:hypothetical protein L596_027597 [Steinernema carpocapsae]|uniref:4Fe-4S ferredoxin-type domain-containing protein n=1 Tax=Steinernema carpocapsae TaxID=34508 RepID=A0A4U5LVZ6_STECR|nr:hypothetical protein L596_027597 [Steinernema carpocapsae]